MLTMGIIVGLWISVVKRTMIKKVKRDSKSLKEMGGKESERQYLG